ncbi:MAG: alkaline phosphatase family protein [Caulobacter sp.]|nr:alkaline phosphatase family protein [Caulobacter sp.]
MSLRRWSSALAALALLATPAMALAAEPKAPPKLVVVISVDQYSANLFDQYRGRYTGGLRTLADEGLVYINGYQSHMGTETCPGHSTILTGKHPNKTGIPANDWLDPETGEEVYCFANPANALADPLGGGNGPVGPDNMKATTLGDWLKASEPSSRVFGISGKDRGAIALSGHKGDGVFWWRDGFGFTTFVEPGQDAQARLAPVAPLNAELKARFAATPPVWTYSHDACRKLEGDYVIAGEAWHTTVPPKKYSFETSPFLDEVTVEGALRLLKDQKLGAGDTTDILAISLSGTDRIGHGFGTQGPEMCEQMYRLDAALGTLLSALKDVPGGAVVVLTADHGGSDFPERLAMRGYPDARRVDFSILPRTNAALKARFNLTVDPIAYDGSGFNIVGEGKKRLPQPLRGEVARAAVELLAAEPDVAAAFTLDELLATPDPAPGTPPEMFTLKQRAALSAVTGRSPDVAVILKPGVYPLRAKVGGAISTHGSAWDYDRRVPILVWWPGATGQERMLPIDTTDIAPTLAHLIDVEAPADVDGRCIDLGGFAVDACPAAPVAAPAPAPTPVAAPAPTEKKKAGFRWPWEKKS